VFKFLNMRFLFFQIIFIFTLFSCKNENKAVEKAQNNVVATPTINPPSAKKSIVFFGNSLTAAYGLAPEQGFTAIIQRRIDSLKLDFQVSNAGVSGNTTADGKSRIDWVLQQPVDIFVLELGGNDALRGLPVADAKVNLQFMIDRIKIKYPSAKIMLAGMQAPPNLGAKYASDFAKMYPDLAKTNNCALIPFLLENVGGEIDLNQKDGIHPTAIGQKIVAENVWRVLEKTLKTPS
jgi:acyl-CoA thioesterase I